MRQAVSFAVPYVRLYADLAALRMQWALVKLALKYSPDQPRVPAGNRDGGQWTDADGGSGLMRVAANDSGEGGIATEAQSKTPEGRGVPVVLPGGKNIPNPYSELGYLISPTPDLNPVAASGREAGALYQRMLATPNLDVQQTAFPQFVGSINAAIGQGGAFDYQRSRENFLAPFVQLPQFRDVSNFNVGIYMQQTGQFSEQDTLSIAGIFARLFSSNYMPDKPYGLDSRTAFFISAGYHTAAGGAFDKAVK